MFSGDNDVATKIDFNSDSSAEEEIVVTKKRKRTEDTPKKKSKKQLVHIFITNLVFSYNCLGDDSC